MDENDIAALVYEKSSQNVEQRVLVALHNGDHTVASLSKKTSYSIRHIYNAVRWLSMHQLIVTRKKNEILHCKAAIMLESITRDYINNVDIVSIRLLPAYCIEYCEKGEDCKNFKMGCTKGFKIKKDFASQKIERIEMM